MAIRAPDGANKEAKVSWKILLVTSEGVMYEHKEAFREILYFYSAL